MRCPFTTSAILGVVTASGCAPCEFAPPPFVACAARDLDGELPIALDFSTTGVVAAIEAVAADETCLRSAPLGRSFPVEGSATVIVLEGDDGVTRVALQDIDLEVAPGDTLTVGYTFVLGGFRPVEARLQVADDLGVLLYAEEGGHIDRFTPPDGVALAAGRELCWTRDDCGGWSRFAVEANGVELGEDPVAAGGLQLRSTGFELQDGGSTNCLDWFVAHALVWGTRE